MTKKTGDNSPETRKTLEDVSNQMVLSKEQKQQMKETGQFEPTEEQRQKLKERLAKKRDQAMDSVDTYDLTEYLDLTILEKDDIIAYKHRWLRDYFASVEKICIINPNQITVNKEMVLEYEDLMKDLPEDSNEYKDFKSSREATLTQIVTLQEDTENRKAELKNYVKTIKTLNGIIKQLKDREFAK